MSLVELQQQYLGLYDEIAEQEAKLKVLKEKKDNLQDILAEQMTAIGQGSTQVSGRKLTVRRTPRIGKESSVSMEQLCQELKRCSNWEFMVKDNVHAQTLQATMKEYVEEFGELPDNLKPFLRQWDQTVVAVTRG